MSGDLESRARIESSSSRAVLAVPLIVQRQVIGALAVGDRAGRIFGAEEVRLAEAFSSHAAVAIENARLYQETRTTRDFLRAVTACSADGIVAADTNGRITYASEASGALLGHPVAELAGRPIADLYVNGRDLGRPARG